MRIAIIALTDFQSFPTGGILTFVRRFVESVAVMGGITVDLIGWKDSITGDLAPRDVMIGARQHRFTPVGEGRLHGSVPDRFQFYMQQEGWRRALRAVGDVDVFYCHSPEAALRVAENGDAPVALHLHGAINTVGRSRFALARFRPIMSLYEGAVLSPAVRGSQAVFATVSDQDFNAFRDGGIVRNRILCRRVPAMVTTRVGVAPRRARGEVLNLVCVGRLERIKGIELLIRSVRRLLQRGVASRLQVVGAGTQRPALERLVADLGLRDAVNFLGSMDQEQVHEVLAGSDIFVSGSHQEGFSLALLEGLSMGLPAVVTDVGSARDVVTDGGTGYVVKGRDPDLFAGHVIAAASARWEMRERCARVAERYTSDRVSSEIVETLRRIAGAGRGD